jgi:drug/metabolite transporter (DMT)-like permease
LLGILLMLGFCVLAPLGDAVAKLLSGAVPLGQLVFIRFAIQAVILIPIVIVTRRPWRTSGRVFKLVVWRTLLHIAGIAFMFTALRYAPSSTLASMQYLEIPIAALIGWLVFGDWPNGLAALGICITMMAGLYVVFRERATLQASQAAS